MAARVAGQFNRSQFNMVNSTESIQQMVNSTEVNWPEVNSTDGQCNR
jgi:hypothetical protein